MAKIVTEGVRASKTHGPEERVESRATNSVNEFEIKGPLLRYASYFLRDINEDFSLLVFLSEDTGPIARPAGSVRASLRQHTKISEA
ncbi:hypothetical protein HZH66_002185 [Vespula vulgaris]|uniref:Uncharacterized protein n=1 Tax=Vespula vulgaris TaxID=7454 RepID=A0A834KJE9_VESVU|nr:hypothetical protein HZH66_002185 [Vespula vulgaris]